MKNKKAMETWGVITAAILAITILAVLLFIVPSRLSAQGKNIDTLSSCKSKQGTCEIKCPESTTEFYKLGCPEGTDTTKEYCCIPNDKS